MSVLGLLALFSLSLYTVTSTLRTYDRCTQSTSCPLPLLCTKFSTLTPCDSPLSLCICTPSLLTLCLTSSTCPSGEICLQSRLSFSTFCASSLALPRIPLLSPAPLSTTSTFPFSDCSSTSPICPSSHVCRNAADISLSCRPDGSRCICLPSIRRICLLSSTCPNEDICVQSALFPLPFCASPRAVARWVALQPLPDLAWNGFTMDPCVRDADCAGERRCVNRAGMGACVQGNACVCMSGMVEECRNTNDCERKEEVCAVVNEFREGIPFCVSLQVVRIFDHVEQFTGTDVCPALLPRRNGAGGGVVRRSSRVDARGLSVRVLGGPVAQPAIVGGTPADAALREVVVALVGRRGLCTGVMVGMRWVLTAAHCGLGTGDEVYLTETDYIQGRVGNRVKQIWTHPEWDPDVAVFRFDIAAVELDAPAAGKRAVRVGGEGKELRVVGFGRTGKGENGVGMARQVDLRVVEEETCNKKLASLPYLEMVNEKYEVCLGGRRERCAVCNGDSGGPVLESSNGSVRIVGIVSLMVECETGEFPAVASRVRAVVGWMKQVGVEFEQAWERDGCKKGERMTENGCVQCGEREVSEGGNARQCWRCRRGFRRDSEDGARCACKGELAIGRGIVEGKMEEGNKCVVCWKGTYSGVDDHLCRKCERGLTSDVGAAKCTELTQPERVA